MMETTIPFAGFYDTLHETMLDDTVEQIFSDHDTGMHVNGGLTERVWNTCNWKKVREAYAADYAREFADAHEIKLTFTTMTSPREYNFTTDRIFCAIETLEVKRLFSVTDVNRLDTVCREMFTSRDGFSSYYNPDYRTWGPVDTWDHNQVGALVTSIVPEDFDRWAEYDLMERAQGNGLITQWIEEYTPDIERLYRIHEYLQTRAAREETDV